jgi:citrate synthase
MATTLESPRRLRPTGRVDGSESLVGHLWDGLSGWTAGDALVDPPTPTQLRALDVALALLVDHGLAASTFAARIAASVRADPYSVIATGLGPLAGPRHGAASAAVHELYAHVAADGVAAAVGALQRRGTELPGFGHAVYTRQDPRYGSLMAALIDGWADDPRLADVYRLRDLVGERGGGVPNIDLALGALTWLAGMPAEAGEVIFAVARSVGWLAHALEEYDERPLRFRPQARYIGATPSAGDR